MTAQHYQQQEPQPIGGSMFAALNTAGPSAVTILAPAANLNGAVVRSAAARNNIADNGGLFTGTATPGTTGSPTNRPAIMLRNNVAGGNAVHLPNPVQIPAGYGLWWVDTTATSDTYANVTYDLY